MKADCSLSACSWLCSFCLGFCKSLPSLFFLFSPLMPALSCARHWRRDPAGTAHICEALFPKASRPLRSYTVTLLCRRCHMADQASLLSVVTCRTSATSDSCSRPYILLTKRLVVSGHLSTNSALLIDRSAEPVETSLPCSWQTLAPLHAGTSQRPRVARSL